MSGSAFSPLRVTAWVLIALGAVLFLSFLGRVGRASFRRIQPVNVWARYAQEASPYGRRRGRTWGAVGGILLLLLALLVAGAGWGLFCLERAARAYAPFPSDEVAGRVQCLPLGEGTSGAMTCTVSLERPAYSETVRLAGVRWGVEVEVLAWDPALERFGLSSGYRVLRLLGLGAEGQVTAEATLPAARGLSDALLRLGRRFVQVRRQTLSGQATSERFYELTVSRAGFSLREW